MEIPKRRESKIKNGDQKRADKFMQVMFVFMTCFFIGVAICIIKFNLEKDKTDNTQKDTSTEQDKTSNIVNITEKEDKDDITNVEEDLSLDSIDGIKDEIDVNEQIKLEDFSEIYTSILYIGRIKNPPVKTNVVLQELFKLLPKVQPHFNKVQMCIEKINTAQFRKAFRLFYMTLTMYELFNDKEINKFIVVKDFNNKNALLGVYLNYSILYYMLYEMSRILEAYIFKDKYYTEWANDALKQEELRIFALKVKNILNKTSKKLYKETKVNIGVLKDSTEGMNIISVYDITKTRNFIRFSILHSLVYIFDLNINKKIVLQTTLKNELLKRITWAEDKKSKKVETKKVEKACTNVYGLFYDNGEKYRESWENDFDSCVESLKQLIDKTKFLD